MSDLRRGGQCQPGSVRSNINVSELQLWLRTSGESGSHSVVSPLDNFDFSLKCQTEFPLAPYETRHATVHLKWLFHHVCVTEARTRCWF